MNLPLITRAYEYKDKIAITTPEGSWTYQDLLRISGQIATHLLKDSPDLHEQRVAFLIPSGLDYVTTQWGIWRAGGVAVPLCVVHPRPELEYVIQQSESTILIAHPSFESVLRPIAEEYSLRFILTSEFLNVVRLRSPTVEPKPLPDIALTRRALILYTSGTTGKPKGVVTTHANIQAQVTSLVNAWGWTEGDRILHVLPLHHIHGIINVLTCALWSGAECYMLSKFYPQTVWNCIIKQDFTLFMAVPTIYSKLITVWEQASDEDKKRMFEGCQKMRLMVSGSAALPVSVLEKWQEISGHFLLERYGMTEIGMALSNPLNGSTPLTNQRRAGFVGVPLPQVETRLVDEKGTPVSPGTPGEIQVRGPGVFREYWQNPEATRKVFQDDWFCTGDFAVVEGGYYRILGRISVDIIKTGGYKVSALEIEEVLRTHPDIRECAVVGIPDPEWGERVGAAVVLHSNRDLTLESLRSWGKEHLAVYKVPTRLVTLEDLPRNAMGKVTKPEVVKRFQG